MKEGATEIPTEAAERMSREGWPSIEEQKAYWKPRLRFVQVEDDPSKQDKTYWLTEEYVDGRWYYVKGTLSFNQATANGLFENFTKMRSRSLPKPQPQPQKTVLREVTL